MEMIPGRHFHVPPLRARLLRLSSRGVLLRSVAMVAAPMTMATYSSAGQVPGSEPKRAFGRAKAATVLALIVLASLWPLGCLADPMVLVESYPVVNQIMDGSATTFALRFDGPVDHAGARLTLVTPTRARPFHDRLARHPNPPSPPPPSPPSPSP